VAQLVGRLTAVTVARLIKPGMHNDGAGLYLQVTKRSTRVAKSWIYRFELDGRERQMGLGSVNTLSLAEARIKASECRKLKLEGIDPIEARKARHAEAAHEAAMAVTFTECAEKYIAAHRDSWHNLKHAAQWSSTLKTYAEPVIGAVSAQDVDTALIMKILDPLWLKKPETAGRLRGRIEAVLDWATVRGYRHGDNPARWRGHLDKLLPARARVRQPQHHAALSYQTLPEFMTTLREQQGVAARALEFLILTATRTSEVIKARPIEISDNVWIIPANRMKARREHRVPLSARALELIKSMAVEYPGEFLFPGGKQLKPLSNMAMLVLLERMGRNDLTVHGFRSTFRDWTAEQTDYPREVAEMALAHTVDDKVEAAYRRGDLFEKRRRLMDEWGHFCAQKTGSFPARMLAAH
jgi:integrase